MKICLEICWIAILLILLLTDDSLSKRGSRRSRGWSRGSKSSGGRSSSGGSKLGSSSLGKPSSDPRKPDSSPFKSVSHAGSHINLPRNRANSHNPGHSTKYPDHNRQYSDFPRPHSGDSINHDFIHQIYFDNKKPWTPKKLKITFLVGPAVSGDAAGAISGYRLGSPMSNLHFQFHKPIEEWWWYENRDRYPDQVYHPQYNQPVLKNVFLRDCVNITIREFIKPTGSQRADMWENKVVTQVVREMCTEQYRLVSGAVGTGNWNSYGSELLKSKRPISEMPQVPEKAVTSAPKGAIVGSSITNMSFQFNNSDEEGWWYENRYNFSDRVYYLEYSQPVSQDIFVNDCLNITLEKFLEPTENQSVDEMADRIVKKVVRQMCTKQYIVIRPSKSKIAIPKLATAKLAIAKPVEKEAAPYVTVAAIGTNHLTGARWKARQKSLDSGTAMFLASPFLLICLLFFDALRSYG